MQITVKKIVPWLAALCLMGPAEVMAQSAEETAGSETATAPSVESSESESTRESSSESESAQESVSEGASAQTAEPAPSESPASGTDAAEPAPSAKPLSIVSDDEKRTDAAEPVKESNAQPKSMPDTLASQKTSQQARKEAMRNLSNSYPVEAAQAAPMPASASTADAAAAPVQARIIPAAAKNSERMPHFEHHGYFRTRLNAFGNYDLDTHGTTPVAVPLDSKHRGTAQQENISMNDEDTHLGANMRFRYQPTLHISESVRIAGGFDIMDNFVLGTSPNGLRTNWGSDAFFTFNGAEPVNSTTFGQNAVSVKALYGEADTLIGTFRAGRVPAQWGLGIIYNDGGVYKKDQQLIEGKGWKCVDCDSSDAVDRVEWQIRDPFFDFLYLAFSWDFVNSGLAGYNLQQDSFGQAFDLGETDDVLQFTLSLFDRPISQQEIEERYRNMYELREWTHDWGVLFSYRKQEKAAEIDALQMGDGVSSTYDLYDKNAEAYVIDLWGRFFVPCPKEVMLRFEAELVGVFGSVDLDRDADGQSRDIAQVGFAFEAEAWWRDLIAGMKTGVAWADNMVFSGHPVIDQLDVVPMGSNMRFDPNYSVDQIMFRELMGGINNAWYLNLYGEYKFPLAMPQFTTALGARLDLTTATAVEKSATPGNAAWYGFEANAKLFYDESDRFRFEIGAGIFVPGAAWTNRAKSGYPILPSQSVYESSTSDNYDPEIAWNVIANLFFMF